MTASPVTVYAPYAWRPHYSGLPTNYGGFAIIGSIVERLPAVLIKQRGSITLDGKPVSSAHLWDLPGGGTDPKTDPDLPAAAKREVWEEVEMDWQPTAAIGEPLYLFIPGKDGRPDRVDCAQAFLGQIEEGSKPNTTPEALAVAFVNAKSIVGYSVVSRKADPTSPIFGRTPVMIWDGLSILHQPWWTGALTPDLQAALRGDPASKDFLLLDGGHYLAQTFLPAGVDGDRHINIYRRLNPDQPDGYFRGELEYLIS